LNFHAWQWVVLVIAALIVGVAKTGVVGLSLVFVALFASVMPAKQATGFVLPLLVVGDVVALVAYGKHAIWKEIRFLLPWSFVGIVVGFIALGRMNEHQAATAIGSIIIALALLYVAKRLGVVGGEGSHGIWFGPLIGLLIGFTTLMSNSSGPLLVIYLLSLRTPKMEYVGTMAVFFFILNLLKLPFVSYLGLVNGHTLLINLELAPAVLAGAWFGKWLLGKMNQRVLENITLSLAVLSGLKLFL
jgi:uncharacterized protein